MAKDVLKTGMLVGGVVLTGYSLYRLGLFNPAIIVAPFAPPIPPTDPNPGITILAGIAGVLMLIYGSSGSEVNDDALVVSGNSQALLSGDVSGPDSSSNGSAHVFDMSQY